MKSTTTSRCTCGQEFIIERGCRDVCRTDGKRVYPAETPDTKWDSYRCHKCDAVVSESVPGAEFNFLHSKYKTCGKVLRYSKVKALFGKGTSTCTSCKNKKDLERLRDSYRQHTLATASKQPAYWNNKPKTQAVARPQQRVHIDYYEETGLGLVEDVVTSLAVTHLTETIMDSSSSYDSSDYGSSWSSDD